MSPFIQTASIAASAVGKIDFATMGGRGRVSREFDPPHHASVETTRSLI